MEKITLSKKDRLSVAWRHQFLQGSWNYERMQNGGWCYSIIPAIKKLYPNKDDQIAALKRHMEFYNTHPYVSAPVMGVTLALEEERANGVSVDDAAIQGRYDGTAGRCRRSGILVYPASDSGSAWCILGIVRKHHRTTAVLCGMECDPLGLYLVYTGVRLQGGNLYCKGSFRWSAW